MPPDVFVGRTVCAAGKLKTFDGGKLWTIIDAVPLTEGQAAMRKLMDALDPMTANPLEWCPDLLERKKAARR